MKNHLLRPMRSGAVMCILAGSLLSAKANTYYFSSSAGDDSRTSTQAQNPSTPWKSLNKLNSFFSSLQPGDNVLFKKGETFVGKLSITRSGVSGSPITISSYGTGSAPVFEYDVANATGSISSRAIIYLQSVNFITIDGIKFTDHTLSANSIHTTRTANVGYGIDTYNCSNLAFTNLDISLIGVGIELNGNYNTISGCNIYDLGMVVNDSYTDNDYGANGIVFAGSYNTFSSNTFQNCWAVSTDYGYDGGAIELFGSVNGQTSNNMITRNKALNNQGFMELGSNSSTDVVANNQVAYNLLINNGGVFYIHNSGSFATGVSNLKFYNNNVVETVIPQSPYPYLFSAASTAPSNTLIVKNNVFWVARSLTVIRSTLSSFTHTNNIFRMSSGTLGFTLTSSELSLGLSTPMFANTSAGDPANWDYHLASASPAIDFGVDLGLTSDYFGNAVYNGKAPDASADESGGSLTVYYRDADADGYGNANDTVTGTSAPKGYVTNSNDCNDNDSTIHPGAVEICDGKDNNCDGRIDETCTYTTYYRDADQDGYGNSADTVMRTTKPAGYAAKGGDCNDNDATINPGAVEICDGKDNNCDGRIDETCTYTTYYRDADQDSYGNSADTVMRTTKPAGYAAKGGDCNDNDATINPGAVEICDGKDNNCDGRIDETCTYTTYYRDADQDGYGNDADTLIRTTRPTGYAAKGGDCNDNDAAINPGAVEVCDGKDNNCDGRIDETCTYTTYYRDADQDGYGNDADTLIRTTKPTGYAAQGGDCNDNDATINPGAVEVCDGKDNNCNGLIDEGCSSKPYITITDASIFKTPGSVTLYVRLSGAATQPVSVDYVTVNGTATSTQSYKSKSGTLTIPAGATSGTIQISIMKDKTKNPDDYFYVQMANAVNGLFADSVGKVSILDSRNLLHLFYYNRYQPFANSTTNTTGQNNALEPGVISIKAQPNPTTSYFRLVIRSNSPQPVSIRVIDMTGRMVEKQENIGANADIIVGSTLKPGFYIIQAIQGKNVTQQKVIKF